MQALHLEANRCRKLPPGPYLACLVVLSIDWRQLFASTAPLSQMSRLETLCLTDGGTPHVGPATPAEVLACLGALPALRRVVAVVCEGAQHRLAVVQASYFGWRGCAGCAPPV